MRTWLVVLMSLSAVASAGGRRGSTGLSFVPSRPFVNLYVSPQVSTRARAVPIYPFQYWYTVPEAPPPPAPAPQVIYIERERAPEPAPAPQVIVIETPAPQVVVEAPSAPVAAAPVVAAPVGPRTPGPDVFQWTDEDGVVHYSTRQPANGKAKKLATLAK